MPKQVSRNAQKPRPRPTTEDGMMMLQIAQVAALRGVHDASNWVWSDKFIPDYAEFVKKYPRGSEGYGKARLVATHYETVGTLWKNKLINADLLFDWLLITGIWDRMKGFVLGERRQANEPKLGENFQKMAAAQARSLR
ncbi:MAG: DUF4760 domain-containing protein [Dehalococcoidia bacterium]